MFDLLFKDCPQLSDKLKEVAGDHNSSCYIYSIRFDNHDHTVDVHVCPQLFKNLVQDYPNYEVHFIQDCVHLYADNDSIRLTTCLLKCNLLTEVSELDKPIEQLYKEYCERTGWPYVKV